MIGPASSFLAVLVAFVGPLDWATGHWELVPEEAGDPGNFTCDAEPLVVTLDPAAQRYHGRLGDYTFAADLLGLGENWLTLQYEDEQRLTDAGMPVEWAMVFVDENHFYWHRLDWPEGSRTSMRRRCLPEEWS